VSRRATLVYNPGAGDEQHAGAALRRQLAEAGYDASLISGKRGLERRLEDPGGLVIVAGGDGSVRRVALALAGRGVPLAILPFGTANNIAKSLGAMGPVDELIAGWEQGERRSLRLGTVRAGDASTRFLESVGVGLFAELVIRGEEEVEENAASLTGHEIDRALLLLDRIQRDQAARFRSLRLDETDLSGEYLLIEAMNIPLVGPNVPLAPEADCGDATIDLVLAGERERDALAAYLRARLGGQAAPLELPCYRGSRLALQAEPEEMHVDDGPWDPEAEATGHEVTLSLDDQVIEVLVPA
jgi:diacylglycerol kinase (ATP)